MPTHSLLLRLAGPMQSWGVQSRHTERDAGREPSKSGVVGLLAAALGRRRSEPVDDLTDLAMAVRVDREGSLRRDYHTALDVPLANGEKPRTVVSNRYYLADADFLVAMSGPDLDLLEHISDALDTPAWPLRLGRAAFPPGAPIRLHDGGVRPGLDGEAALLAEAWRSWPTDRPGARPARLRAVLEAAPGPGAERRFDRPGPGAAFAHRRFLPRYVRTTFWGLGDGPGMIPIGEAWDV